MIINKTYCLIFVLIATLSFGQEGSMIKAKILHSKNDSFITINATVKNETAIYQENLTYNLMALRKDASNSYTTNKQQGEFSLAPIENKKLAEVTLHVRTKEELKVYLFVKKNNVLVAKDTLFIGTNIVQQKNDENEESFSIKGLVIEEATTKIGKDFYDLFYQKYLLSGLKYPFVVKVKERPSIRRTTIVNIYADDSLVYQFMTRPGDDFLDYVLKQTFAKLEIYAKESKKIKTYKI